MDYDGEAQQADLILGGASMTTQTATQKALSIFEQLRRYYEMKWHIFTYNFSWPDYLPLFDGWLARTAVAIPFFGYLILFNDSVSDHLTFKTLTRADQDVFGLSTSARLKFVYLGLLFLFAANVFYRVRRPYVLRLGRDQYEYVEAALKHFTVSHYININDTIRHSGFDPYTQNGKYHDADFEKFVDSALSKNGIDTGFHWADAKAKYENLLRDILIENFFRNKIATRKSLTACIFLALFGYGLLLVPSADLFIKVMRVIVGSILGG